MERLVSKNSARPRPEISSECVAAQALPRVISMPRESAAVENCVMTEPVCPALDMFLLLHRQPEKANRIFEKDIGFVPFAEKIG